MKRIGIDYLDGSVYYEIKDDILTFYDSDLNWIGNCENADLFDDIINGFRNITDRSTFNKAILNFCEFIISSDSMNGLIEECNDFEDSHIFVLEKEYYSLKNLLDFGVNRIGEAYFVIDLD